MFSPKAPTTIIQETLNPVTVEPFIAHLQSLWVTEILQLIPHVSVDELITHFKRHVMILKGVPYYDQFVCC